LAFSYWIDIPWFRTKGKLAAILIKPSLGVPNWPVIYFISYTPTSSLALLKHRAIKSNQRELRKLMTCSRNIAMHQVSILIWTSPLYISARAVQRRGEIWSKRL
jgi:hypothetical protein